ncbi:MAG: hypothetical protein HY961_11955 [Ignavibacteriae bacterium]|nr:hypothetical protein [Ignavibacteriota bacterium]
MKPTIVTAFAVLALLSSIGASCVNDDVLVVLNLGPIVGKYRVPPGENTTFAGSITIRLDSLIPPGYASTLKQARVYDIRVRVEGAYDGRVSGESHVKVGSGTRTSLIKFPASGSAPWSSFSTPQSLLGSSPLLAPDPSGISQLLQAFSTTPLPTITLFADGHLDVAPVPGNLYVIVEVYLQADATLN